MRDPRTLSQLGDVRLAALDLGTQRDGITREFDGWHPGYPNGDGRVPFNDHTIATLVALGLMRSDGDTARTTQAGRDALRAIITGEHLEAAE